MNASFSVFFFPFLHHHHFCSTNFWSFWKETTNCYCLHFSSILSQEVITISRGKRKKTWAERDGESDEADVSLKKTRGYLISLLWFSHNKYIYTLSSSHLSALPVVVDICFLNSHHHHLDLVSHFILFQEKKLIICRRRDIISSLERWEKSKQLYK